MASEPVLLTLDTVTPESHFALAALIAASRVQVPSLDRSLALSWMKSHKDDFDQFTGYDVPPELLHGNPITFHISASPKGTYYLEMMIFYSGSDWIFWDTALFKINDEVIEVNVPNVTRDNHENVSEAGVIPLAQWDLEHKSVDVNPDTEKILMGLLRTSGNVKVRLRGKHSFDFELKPDDLQVIQRVVLSFARVNGWDLVTAQRATGSR